MEKPSQGIRQLPHVWDTNCFTQYVKAITEEEWNIWSFRQSKFKTHQHTRTIKVQWIPLSVEFFDESKIEKNEPYYSQFKLYLNTVFNFLEDYYEGKIYKVIITELKPRAVIPPHSDKNFSLEVPHRIHIPVITNKDVIFSCGDMVLNMVPGHLYEINNQCKHSVENNSDECRVHVIVDVIENKDTDINDKEKSK